jgi:predicted nicotinamide N-methyase
LADCGKQLWLSSLLLADYFIYRYIDTSDVVVFELGCGVGLSGVVLSLLKPGTCFLTDADDSILNYSRINLDRNSHLFQRGLTNIYFKVFDWKIGRNNFDCHNWAEDEINLIMQNEVVFLAADVIYDDSLTDALFASLAEIMKPTDILILALDKRFNFEVDSMSLVAHGYANFLEIVDPHSTSHRFYHRGNDKNMLHFQGVKINLSEVPLSCSAISITNHNKGDHERKNQIYTENLCGRSPSLELWEIRIFLS